MISKIDHLGILVDDIDQNRSLFERLGLEVGAVERVPEFGVEIAFIRVGESLVELVEPVDQNADLAAEFEATEQTALIHHIAFRVDDLERRLAMLKNDNVPLEDELPRRGAGGAKVAFLAKQAANGVRIELVEREADITLDRGA